MERQPKGAGPESTGTEQHEHEQQQEALQRDRPRIYAASLSDYNTGVLHGEWIDAAQEPEQIHEAVNAMLSRSPTDPRAEEFAVHDYEGFGHYRPGEYDSLEWLSSVASGIAEHGPAFAAWADQVDQDQEALDQFEDAFLGEWPSTESYAYSLLDDLGLERLLEQHLPESLAPYVYVDAHGFARDLELSGDITAIEGDEGVWIFDRRVR